MTAKGARRQLHARADRQCGEHTMEEVEMKNKVTGWAQLLEGSTMATKQPHSVVRVGTVVLWWEGPMDAQHKRGRGASPPCVHA